MLEQKKASSAQMMGREGMDGFEVSWTGGAKCFTPSRLGDGRFKRFKRFKRGRSQPTGSSINRTMICSLAGGCAEQ